MPAILRSRLLLVLALAAAGLVVERLWVTDVEAVEAVAEGAVEAVRARDWAGLEARLHPEFAFGGLDRAASVAWMRRLVERRDPRAIDVSLHGVSVEGDEAQARAVVAYAALGRPVRAAFQVAFRRTAEGWRVASAR